MLAYVLLAAILLLSPMAYASDVDPSWGGLYDDGDGDYAVQLITGGLSAVESAPLLEVGPALAIVGTVGHADPVGSRSVSRSLRDSRSPPAA